MESKGSTIIITVILFLVFIPMTVFADHMMASVSIPQGTSVPGCEQYNECYVTYEVTVDVGGKVYWSNDDTAAHTVTAGSAADGPSGLFDSGLFMTGTTFSHTFESAGEFPYHCIVHPWMAGIVTVIDDSTNTGPPITVKTNSYNYREGDTIYVSGEVSEILFGYAISFMMIAPNGDVILIDQIMVDSNGKYQTAILAEGSLMIDDGVYTIQVLYATENRTAETTFTFTESTSMDVTPPKILQPKDIEVDAENPDGITIVTFDVLVIDDTDKIIQPTCNPRSGSSFTAGVYTVTCAARDSAGNYATQVSFTITVNPPETSIPSWVKNVAEFWCEDKIDDAAFVEGIQYLIDNDIIVIPTAFLSGSGSYEIPQWIKNNACWWSKGLITDDDFVQGIQYLIREGIIKV